MNTRKRKKLEAAGFQVGSAAEFLELTPEEAALIDLKLSLGTLVRTARTRAKLSQQRLAGRLHSSQSRIAKVEAGDTSVSLDLIVRAAFAAGARRTDLARVILRRKHAATG
jgi:ribosome-binding protein aMBF1 (putative translation factor)